MLLCYSKQLFSNEITLLIIHDHVLSKCTLQIFLSLYSFTVKSNRDVDLNPGFLVVSLSIFIPIDIYTIFKHDTLNGLQSLQMTQQKLIFGSVTMTSGAVLHSSGIIWTTNGEDQFTLSAPTAVSVTSFSPSPKAWTKLFKKVCIRARTFCCWAVCSASACQYCFLSSVKFNKRTQRRLLCVVTLT